MVAGVVGNIQHYSIHDGPGIRTTLFLKGCPLACLWCHNPENIGFEPQVCWQKEKCIGCGECKGRHGQAESELCPTLAIEKLGKTLSLEEALHILLKDALFYESSGGGVTLSGGEPLSQPEFTLGLLRALKQEGIHTTLDTCGHGPWPVLEAAAAHTDLFLYDIKHLDPAEHQALTGLDNRLILENLGRLAASGGQIWLRVPILPGLNDDPAHIHGIGDLARRHGINEVYLLPYHHLAVSKYQKLGLSYRLPDLAEPSAAQMENLQQILVEKGLKAHIGG